MRKLFSLVGRLLAMLVVAGVARPWAAPTASDVLEPLEQRPEERAPRPGWNRPKPGRTPKPTYWPMVFALGITFMAWGIIANTFVFCLGAILFISGVAGWIGDLLDEE